MTEGEPPPEPDPAAIMGQRSFLGLLVLAAVGAWDGGLSLNVDLPA